MTQKRDTVNYTLRDRHEVVYHGITDDPERRYDEHKRSGKQFTSMTYTAKRTRESAFAHEREDIERYERNQGRKPKYNKIL